MIRKPVFFPSLLLIALVLFLSVSCSKADDQNAENPSENRRAALRVGFSQMNHSNPWRVAETNDMKRVAEKLGIELILMDAKSSQSNQIQHIEEMVRMGLDYIVCTPIVAEGWERAFAICRDAGIPLIMLDREAYGEPGRDFLTFVGSDFVEEAERAARWLADQTGSRARVVELKGREGASCVYDRAKGFRTVINSIPDMEIVASEFADFERITGQIVMEQIILTYGREFDAVYAHNDEMAIGAIQALKAAEMIPGEDVLVVSIDGSKDALKSIMAGTLGASIECTPYLADEVFNTILAHRAGESIPPRVIVEDRLFDAGNAAQFFDEAF
jgi:ABC-type sugar transport system substrate-binding protein